MSFDCELPQTLNYAPMISVQVYDYDRFDADDFIGRMEFSCNKASRRFPGEPKWYPLHMDDSERVQGELLCSFQLLPTAEALRVPIPDIIPQFKVGVLLLFALA